MFKSQNNFHGISSLQITGIPSSKKLRENVSSLYRSQRIHQVILLPFIQAKICTYIYIYAKSLQSCPTLCDPIDGSPPGSPNPWDSPGKNTGVGCHFLLQCMKVKSEREVAQSSSIDALNIDFPQGSFLSSLFSHPGKGNSFLGHLLSSNAEYC